jgi:cytochrome c-type biogenesis protein CcsB
MERLEFYFFNLAYFAYTLALALYLAYAFTKREDWARAAFKAVIFGAALHAVDFATRAYVGHALHGLRWYVPWSNWFESFSLFSFVIAVTFVIVQRSYRLPMLGVFVMPLLWFLATFSMAYPLFGSWEELHGWNEIWAAVLQSRAIPYLMPALQSYWMAIHVPMMFVSYSAFAIAFAVGIIYLIQERHLKARNPTEFSESLPALEPLDRMIYRLVGWGFPVLTLGIILGARWAYDAWGRYWGWDAKETWALITWFTYAIKTHLEQKNSQLDATKAELQKVIEKLIGDFKLRFV